MKNPTFMKTYIDGLNIPIENTIDIIGIICFSAVSLIFILTMTYIYYKYFNLRDGILQ